MPAGKEWLLAIDTSTETAGIALYNGTSVYELTWRAGRNQTVSLLAQITQLLDLNHLDLHSVGALAVAIGPGTFNGLRVGLSTAKGISYGHRIPIVGIDTLEMTAYPHRFSGNSIRAFVPAGRGRTVYCDYRNRNGRWVRTGSPENSRFEELATGLAERTTLVGEVPEGQELKTLSGEHIEIPAPALRARRPSYAAEIAFRRWSSGDVDDIAALEPVYVHGRQGGSG